MFLLLTCKTQNLISWYIVMRANGMINKKRGYIIFSPHHWNNQRRSDICAISAMLETILTHKINKFHKDGGARLLGLSFIQLGCEGSENNHRIVPSKAKWIWDSCNEKKGGENISSYNQCTYINIYHQDIAFVYVHSCTIWSFERPVRHFFFTCWTDVYHMYM